ncbi:MAG: GGDEF domain-containing protein [Anaerolineales bacterium]|nr:GGDEF domain-containing protein [Anaerolineales bacterium]
MFSDFVDRFGAIGSTVILTFVSIIISVVCSILVRLVAGMPFTWPASMIAAIVPLLIAPPLVFSGASAVEELLETRSKLELIANFDTLTGVPSRAHFIHLAEEALMEAPEAEPVGLAIFDIDRFKLINDTYGHLVVDEALQLIARTVSVQLRESDIFGRFGGDEFILLMPNTSSNEIQSMCHLLLTHIQTLSVGIKDVRTRLSITMGVTSAVPAAVNLNDLIARADSALLHAKRQGGGRVRYI